MRLWCGLDPVRRAIAAKAAIDAFDSDAPR
jgi:hypothetical protein